MTMKTNQQRVALQRLLEEPEEPEDNGIDPRLLALVEGRLAPEQRAALEGEAQTDPELARALALFRPLDRAFQARIASQLGSATHAPQRSLPTAMVDDGSARGRLRPRPRLRRLLWGLPLAAAAALLLIPIVGPRPLAPLPSYQLETSGNAAVVKGGPAPSAAQPTLGLDNQLTLVLRPQTTNSQALEVRLYALRQGALRRLDVALDHASHTGSFRLETTPRRLGLSAGDWEVVAVYGRPGRIPPDERLLPQLLAAGSGEEPAAWRSQRQPLRILE